MKWTIDIQQNPKRPSLPPAKDLGFGKYFGSHMFVAHFHRNKGWYNTKIVPYAPFEMDPAAGVLHYGQALFEGLKAFKRQDGSLAIFRPQFNWERMRQGADRLVMEAPPLDLWMESLLKLIRVSEPEVPVERGTSMYIRPTLIATEGFLGVRPSDEYMFYVILSPVSSYYSEGKDPVRIWVETDYLRAAPGGLGATKAAANYAGSLKAALHAKKNKYSQVLWLDVTKTFVEEVGTMNVFFVIGDEIVTPSLTEGTILQGGTRQVVIQLLKDKGYKVSERKISMAEILAAHKLGQLKEAFGTGTAAVISSIGELASDKFKIIFPAQGAVAGYLYDEITGIHYGEKADKYGWMVSVP